MSNKFKILLIEDNCDIIQLVKIKAKEINAEITIATNTSEYFYHISNETFDLVICDIALDYAEEGRDIATLHKQLKIETDIIAFTASDHLKKEVLLNDGFTDVVYKNIYGISKLFEHLSQKILV